MGTETEDIFAGHSLKEYITILRRRRAIILQAFVLISVVSVVLALMAKPVYQASAKLLVEGPSYNMNTIDTANPLASLFELSQQQTVETQVEVLQAEPLVDAVMRQVGQASLTVASVKDTNVIQVTAESGDPKIAAAAPNTLLKTYIDEDTDQSLSEMENARQFIEKQAQLSHIKLAQTESALKTFKQQNNVAELARNRDDQISQINGFTAESQKAQLDLATLRAQITANRFLLSEVPPTSIVKTQTTNSVLASLQNDIRNLEVQREGMTQPGGYGPEAPQVRAVDAQIAELQKRLAEQPTLTPSETIGPNTFRQSVLEKIADLVTQIPPLQTQVTVTAQRLADAKAKIGKYAGLELTLDRLTREHDAAVSTDKSLNDQLADLTLREKAHHATAHIIESAQVPSVPVRPKRLQSIIFGCLIGLFVGICLALLQEFLDDRINSMEEANRVLGLPSLGHVPALSSEDAHLLPQMKGLDPASESYRVLRTNIHFASVDAPVRTLLVTSANPGEGKTTTAANLAFAMAMDGKKVLLVDTDLRRPSLHKLLGVQALPGLTDVLLGHAELNPQEVMPGMSVLTAGSTPPNPGELLNSRTFRNLVDHLTEQVDIVIFDSPPILVAADAAILASQMDGTVMVVETGSTKKAAAKRTLQLLSQARANILGVAYNKMRVQDSSEYYYYQYQYGTPGMMEETTRQPRTLLPATVAFTGSENHAADAVLHDFPGNNLPGPDTQERDQE